MNPNLKRPDAILYRDLEKQNDWLRSNVFDSMGNYLEEVEEQSPGDYIIMPENELSSFKIWWRSVSLTSVVSVRFPHACHGNSGKTSNCAKTKVLDDF